MNTVTVRPGIGIGPIDIGMARSDAIAGATAAGLMVEDFRRGPGHGKPDLVINGQLFAYFDGAGRVEEVEVGLSADEEAEFAVVCLDLDLAASYEAVLRRMSAISPVDDTDPEYPGTSAYPELGLVLWADAKAEDLPDVTVETILVRRPAPGQHRS